MLATGNCREIGTGQSMVVPRTLGSRMTPGCLAYQSSRRPMLGWITLTPACAAAIACTKLHRHRRGQLVGAGNQVQDRSWTLLGWNTLTPAR